MKTYTEEEVRQLRDRIVEELVQLEDAIRWREVYLVDASAGMRGYNGTVGAYMINVCRAPDAAPFGTVRDDVTNEILRLTGNLAILLWERASGERFVETAPAGGGAN